MREKGTGGGRDLKVLIIEDDPVIQEFLSAGLRYEGYEPAVTATGRSGLQMAKDCDMILLDVMLPDMDGFEICRRIRARGLDVPLLMLTVRGDVEDRVRGLDAGADDYVTKPFSFDELLARMRAVLRRRGKDWHSERLAFGDLVLDTSTREVRRGGKEIVLTPAEFRLLELFMRHPHRVFTRQTLLNRVFGYDYAGGSNVVDVHVSRLRAKLGDRPPKRIRTVYGVGYRFVPGEGSL